MQLAPGALLDAALARADLSGLGHIALGRDVAPSLAAEGRGAAAKNFGDLAKAMALKAQAGERDALFGLQLAVAEIGHRGTLLAVLVLRFRLETAQPHRRDNNYHARHALHLSSPARRTRPAASFRNTRPLV